MSVKSEWTWKRTPMCMKVYDKREPLYVQTDVLGEGLGAG